MPEMKRFLIITTVFCLLLVFSAKAQSEGRTYYDGDKTQLKEAYMMQNINGSTVKQGSYFMYYQNGKLQVSGTYLNNQKTGEWKYYDESGKLLRTEKYKDGKAE
jgi:antitoxin component YwqK of YwqJK toxin-antitoxin module